jgi:hypothetical protein
LFVIRARNPAHGNPFATSTRFHAMTDQPCSVMIDYQGRKFEVQGTEPFVRAMVRDLRALMENQAPRRLPAAAASTTAHATTLSGANTAWTGAPSATSTASASPRRVAGPARQNTAGNGAAKPAGGKSSTGAAPAKATSRRPEGKREGPTVAAFVAEKDPPRNPDSLVVFFTYYVTKKAGQSVLRPADLLTCFGSVGIDAPDNLGEAVAKARARCLVTGGPEPDTLVCTPAGMGWVETGLPMRDGDNVKMKLPN